MVKYVAIFLLAWGSFTFSMMQWMRHPPNAFIPISVSVVLMCIYFRVARTVLRYCGDYFIRIHIAVFFMTLTMEGVVFGFAKHLVVAGTVLRIATVLLVVFATILSVLTVWLCLRKPQRHQFRGHNTD